MIINNNNSTDKVLSAHFTRGIFSKIWHKFQIKPGFTVLNYGKITRSVIFYTTADLGYLE